MKTFTFCFPPNLRKRLQAIADDQGRTLSNLLVHIITRYLKNSK